MPLIDDCHRGIFSRACIISAHCDIRGQRLAAERAQANVAASPPPAPAGLMAELDELRAQVAAEQAAREAVQAENAQLRAQLEQATAVAAAVAAPAAAAPAPDVRYALMAIASATVVNHILDVAVEGAEED